MIGFACPQCQGDMIPYPVEPIYTMDEAALLVPCSKSGIRQLISRHKDKLQPALYRRHPSRPKLRVRFLYGSDIAALRGVLFSNTLYPKKGVAS